jgi:hypothetical protein
MICLLIVAVPVALVGFAVAVTMLSDFVFLGKSPFAR